MIEFELDGKTVSAKPGSTILEVALQEGKYIPHFCYHKKLSIAANCRMCLVEVEKARGPAPACATPITEGMKVHTCSKMAVEAQQGVMEFLLINHPLDCPICDQGGECQLQDLAVGYGRSTSRFEEDKRAVVDKDLGPLVKTTMTRCIHCSRCVRFTDEIAGFQELGMSYRNNHVEVMPFIGKTVDSELSGNIIDICPVGALTSKPFRDTARSWELSRRKSISPHDALGSNIQVHVDKYHKVVRVLPLENDAINECWLSDRDRFSYEGLYHEERVTEPMIKQDGKWIKVDWETALNYAAKSINGVKMDHGSDAIGVLASAISTTEELHLLQKMMRGIGVNNLDYRLGQQDFSLDGKQEGVNYLGSSIADFAANKSILVIGSMLREEQPLLAQRLRQAAKHDNEIHLVSLKQEDVKIKLSSQITVDPRKFALVLGKILKAACKLSGKTSSIDLGQIEPCEQTQAIAESLLKNNGHIVLGRIARSLADYGQLLILSNEIAAVVGGKSGILPDLANELGAQLVGFTPYRAAFNGYFTKGLNARQMLENQRKAYVLLNTELERDAYNTQLALAALNKAETVVVMSAYINEDMLQYADVILPITPFTETAGSYVNMEGTWQMFNGVTRPLGDSKPAWKVIRVLGNKFNLDGFEQDSIEDVRSELNGLKDTSSYLNNNAKFDSFAVSLPTITGLIRFGITGIYSGDSIVRRATSLQQTAWAKLPMLAISNQLASKLNLVDGNEVVVKQSHAQNKYNVAVSETVASDVVLLAKDHSSINFAGSYDAIELNA
ncbi:MAG TPA: NADH-quinone oxidoreductase subunit NuoG [Burkholderiales bacterium]|nr:NADH-quinone oxidoreductase subunit NuoG [Burkholderiales bacterium]